MENQASDVLGTEATGMPKTQFVSIVGVLQDLTEKWSGKTDIAELVHALTRVYDGDAMMIYDGGCYGLASPVGGRLGTVGGYNDRVVVVTEMFNSCFWKSPNASICGCNANDYMVTKEDAKVLVEKLEKFFSPDVGNDTAKYLDTKHANFANKLHAAICVWEAMQDPKTRGKGGLIPAMESWLTARYQEFGLVYDQDGPNYKRGDCNKGTIKEIAKIANWNKKGGATKTA